MIDLLEPIYRLIYCLVLLVQVVIVICLAMVISRPEGANRLVLRYELNFVLACVLGLVAIGAALSLFLMLNGGTAPGPGVFMRTVSGTAVFVIIKITHHNIFWPQLARNSAAVRLTKWIFRKGKS